MDILLLEEAMKTVYSALAAEFGLVRVKVIRSDKPKNKDWSHVIDSKASRNLNNKVSSNNYTLPKICMDFFNKLYEWTSQIA